MNIVEVYRNRIRQASSLEYKQQLADELHHLADSFDEVQKQAYQQAMAELQIDITRQLEMIGPVMQRANAILGQYSTTDKV